MSDTYYIYQTAESQERAIQRFGAMAAHRALETLRRTYSRAVRIDALPATEIYDVCRDHAYDMLAVRQPTHGDLVDLLLVDVTEVAVALVEAA